MPSAPPRSHLGAVPHRRLQPLVAPGPCGRLVRLHLPPQPRRGAQRAALLPPRHQPHAAGGGGGGESVAVLGPEHAAALQAADDVEQAGGAGALVGQSLVVQRDGLVGSYIVGLHS